MVQLMKSGDFGADRGAASCGGGGGGDKLPVKLEIVEDPLEEEHGPLNKRSRDSSSLEQVRSPSERRLFVLPENWRRKREMDVK